MNISSFQKEYSNCKGCSSGIKFCQRPCWPIPSEAKALIEAGHGNRLMLDFWARRDDEGGDIMIVAPANPNREGQYAPGFLIEDAEDEEEITSIEKMEKLLKTLFSSTDEVNGIRSGCVFQSPEGLCELHNLGLKPAEGKKSCCKIDLDGLHWAVAETWESEEGRAIVELWKKNHLKTK